jgi:hypothetical protein
MIQDWDATGKGLPVPMICSLFDEMDSFRCLKVETVPAGHYLLSSLKIVQYAN